MAWRESFYSRMVAWLKIILPLAALGLLATLFLLSRSIDPNNSIPFSQIDLKERARDQQVTAPYFSGASPQGDLIAFTATAARPDPTDKGRAIADNPSARIKLTSGTLVTFQANKGILDESADSAILSGNVVMTSSIGYVVRTDALTTGMRDVHAETQGPVTADGPLGKFSAGKMQLSSNPETKEFHLLFTGGVNLLYQPAK